jgi:hypothetical protein
MFTIAAIMVVILVGVLFAMMAVTPVLVETDRPKAERRLKLVVANNDSTANSTSKPARVA